jgi:hypothetical protein
MKDVALFAIRVIKEGKTRIAMGVVLDGSHPTHNTDFVTAKINNAIKALVAAAAVAAGDHPAIIATFAAVFCHHQAAFRLAPGYFTEIAYHPGASTGGVRAIATDSHG